MWINKSPYWLKPNDIPNLEKLKDATYMGYWCTKSPSGNWNESPVDVFHVANPDTSKGHSPYFGLFYRDDTLLITDAQSAFSEPIVGILCFNKEVIVSRYRHDFIQRNDAFVDGGRDYVRSSSPATRVLVTIDGPDFKFEKTE
jgi:hypothetical protein